MKKQIFIFTTALLLCWSVSVSAALLDLGTFTADPGATVSGNQVLFSESFDSNAIYFYNDNFLVPTDATILSFNYDFALGAGDYDDYFTFDQDFTSKLLVDVDVSNGSFSLDLSSLRGSTISLAWGLVWGGDDLAGSTARLFNLDLGASGGPVSVPEPEQISVIIFGLFIIGFAAYMTKKGKMAQLIC